LKQLGSAVFSEGRRLRFRDGHAGDWSEWPKGVRVREMPQRPAAKAQQAAFPLFAEVDDSTSSSNRIPLEVVEAPSKGRQAALKAWETRRRKQQKQKGSQATLKEKKTRNENERK